MNKNARLKVLIFQAFIFSLLLFGQAQIRHFGNRPQVWPLFTAAGFEYQGFDALAPQALRYRAVQVNPRLFERGAVKLGDAILVSPFDREAFVATIERVQADINGVLSLRGRVEGTLGGYFLISMTESAALGSLTVPDQDLEYAITYVASQGVHIVQEVDRRSKHILEDDPAPVPSTLEATTPRPPLENSLRTAAASNIDLMIVYTANARNWAAGQGGINLVIAQSVQYGQLALDNSATGLVLRLVHSALVDYQESGSSSTDLNRLTSTSDGYMDEIHAWRNAYGADMVDIFEAVDDTGGIAWLLMSTSGQPAYAFSLVRVQQASWSYTMIHELGHNFGCHHRKDQTTQPGPGIFSYSAGWRWIGNNGNRYCSVMSYQDTWDGYAVSQVGYFSSPLVLHLGALTGDAVNGDNARTLRQTGPVVANYRAEAPGPEVYYWLTVAAGKGGTTNPTPGKYQYKEGAAASVTAKPDTHYLFTDWSGDAPGTANPLTVTMTADKSVMANFLRIIYPPSNAGGEKILNRSLSQAEYINILRWQANLDNEDIVGYRIYLVEDADKTLLTETDASTFEIRYRRVAKDKDYTYWITAVNSQSREGDPAVVVIH